MEQDATERPFSSGFVQSRRRRRGGTDHVRVPMQCTSVWLLVAFCLFFFSRWLGGKCLLERAWDGWMQAGIGGLEVGGWRYWGLTVNFA
ncbi:hypothetical protein J3F84DRAFT_365181 [Trichoderma pleuroticola]